MAALRKTHAAMAGPPAAVGENGGRWLRGHYDMFGQSVDAFDLAHPALLRIRVLIQNHLIPFSSAYFHHTLTALPQ
jgi:hypothetical protein